MLRKLLPLLFLLFSFKALAMEFPIKVTEYIDDVKIDAYINEKDLLRTKKWTPFESPPPLSVAAAMTAIKNYISADSDFSNTTLIGVELKKIPHHKSYWHYLVKVKTVTENNSQPNFYVVLMDGKVVSAIKEPESIK